MRRAADDNAAKNGDQEKQPCSLDKLRAAVRLLRRRTTSVASNQLAKQTVALSDRCREVRKQEALAGSNRRTPFEADSRPDVVIHGSRDSRRTLTRQALVSAIVDRCAGFSRSHAKWLLDAVIEEMIRALAFGKPLRFRNFGTFVIRAKSARPGRNPRTGANVPISARKVVVFRAAAHLKAAVNSPAPIKAPAKGHAKAHRLIDLERRARFKRIDEIATQKFSD